MQKMRSVVIKSNREGAFDIARGIGILLMVMGHTGFGMEFDKIIHTFHMPLFFFFSGYFFRPTKHNNFLSYLFHQINVLLIPYIIFAFFYLGLHYLYTGEFSIKYFILSLVTPNQNRINVAGALWFLMSLFSAKIIYYILLKSIRSFCVQSLVIIAISIVSMSLRQNYHVKLCLCLDSAMSMLVIVHLGHILYKYRLNSFIKKLIGMPYWGIALLTIVFFVSGFENGTVNIRCNWYNNFILYAISCICGILLTVILSQKLNKIGNSILSKIKIALAFFGRESLVFLLINELIIFIVSEMMIVLGMSRDIVNESYWVHGIVVMGSMLIMSVVAILSDKRPLCIIFGKTRLLNMKKFH